MNAEQILQEQVWRDGRDFITDHADETDDWDDMYDKMFAADDVTGNGPYGYSNPLSSLQLGELIFDSDLMWLAVNNLGLTSEDLVKHVFGEGESGCLWLDCILRITMMDQLADELEEFYEKVWSQKS